MSFFLYSRLNQGEVYAPNYRPGERVALIRHPHGGPFEIPELIVNNKNPEAVTALVWRLGREWAMLLMLSVFHPPAARLSGADFDGDQVIVIPNSRGDLKTALLLPDSGTSIRSVLILPSQE
jgi:hypothetical protein